MVAEDKQPTPPVRLAVETGALSGQSFTIAAGESLSFGSGAGVAAVCLSDAGVSLLHFVVENLGSQQRVRDLNSRTGTLLNGVAVRSAALSDGDELSAGAARLRVQFEEAGQDETAPVEQAAARALLDDPAPLYALLDAAREPSVLPLAGSLQTRSLFEGPAGDELAHVAPYIVTLPGDPKALEECLRRVWGQRQAVFLHAAAPLNTVREHFRSQLMVTNEAGRRLYFRFYDPRVLSSYLPTCRPAEAAELFGPATCFCLEGAAPRRMERFERSAGGVARREVKL